MTNKMMLCVAVFTVVLGQACSKDNERETSEYKDEGTFTGDPETTIKSDGKFLCDFQWTLGPKNWNYDKASGDNPVNEKEEAKEPWCLIPYEDSTEFFITTKSDENVEDYICRDLNAQYSLKNEERIDIINSLGEAEYETHKQMMCVPINSVVVTAQNTDLNYKDEKLYHIRKIEDIYGIAGHLNLRLVKPVHLSVLWEPIWNYKAVNGLIAAKLDIAKIKEDWKRYMEMAGYYIDIKTVPIIFPNAFEKLSGNVDDGALTLPQEKDILELPDKMVSWYNESAKVINGIGDYFGIDIDIPKLNETDYTIAVTPGYKVRYSVEKKLFTPTPGDTAKTLLGQKIQYGSCYISLTSNQLSNILNDIKEMPNSSSLVVYYYSRNGNLLGAGVFLAAFLRLTEQDCNNVSYAEGENSGKEPQSFSIKKGYVLSDVNFFNSKNAGRLLAALLYSKILEIKYPIKSNNDGRWLSSYTDESEVEQPRDHWRGKNSGDQQENIQQELLEFASIMQYFKGE